MHVLQPSSLKDNKYTVHTSSTVRLAVVGILSSSLELHGEGIIFLSHLVEHGDSLLIDSSWDGVLVENNVMGTTLVVDPVIRTQENELFIEQLQNNSAVCLVYSNGWFSDVNLPLDGVTLTDADLVRNESE